MELRQLRYLVALDEERNFTRAAAREHIAQPALSQQIRRLEEELGLALVDRTTRRVVMSDAGVALVARARRILSEVDAGRAGEEFISDRAGARLGELLTAAGQQACFEPRVKLESNESRRIRRLVERGMGVAILPRSDAEGPGAAVAVARLTAPSLTRDIT